MALVRLLRSWNGGFRRTVRDEDGQELDVLKFAPGEVLELDELEMAAIKDDLGKALEEVELVDNKFRPVGFETQNPNAGDLIKKSPRRALAEQQGGEDSAATKKSRRGKPAEDHACDK